MLRQIPERDWKEWRKLSATLLERFCAHTLEHVARYTAGPESAHERYVSLFRYLKSQDRKIAAVFDDQRRSNAYQQIAAAVARGILPANELSVFSDETQTVIRLLLGEPADTRRSQS